MYGIYANIWGILMVNVTIYSIHGSYGYPPTLAFAKAGAAPGTTGGVDPVFLEPLPRRGSCLSCTFATPTLQAKRHHKATAMAQGIPPAAAMASYRRSRLPFDRLQTLKTLKMPRRPFACIALCCYGVHASGTPAGKSHHKATAMAQGIPPAAAMACSRRSRLPFDRLQTLRFKPLKCLAGRLPA